MKENSAVASLAVLAQPVRLRVFRALVGAGPEACPVFHGVNGQPMKVHWGYPDPSHAEGGEDAKRRAFELTRQAIAYRMLQLLALPLETMDRQAMQEALGGPVRVRVRRGARHRRGRAD